MFPDFLPVLVGPLPTRLRPLGPLRTPQLSCPAALCTLCEAAASCCPAAPLSPLSLQERPFLWSLQGVAPRRPRAPHFQPPSSFPPISYICPHSGKSFLSLLGLLPQTPKALQHFPLPMDSPSPRPHRLPGCCLRGDPEASVSTLSPKETVKA